MKTRGVTVSDLGSEVVDPAGPFGVIIGLIAAATGIPQRILLGSERGELASSQDASNWAGAIASRQLNFAEPTILRPLIDRFIQWGALPPPSARALQVVWDALFELNDQERAMIGVAWADAIQKLDSGLWYAAGDDGGMARRLYALPRRTAGERGLSCAPRPARSTRRPRAEMFLNRLASWWATPVIAAQKRSRWSSSGAAAGEGRTVMGDTKKRNFL